MFDPNFCSSKSAMAMSFWTGSVEASASLTADYWNFFTRKLRRPIGTIAASSRSELLSPLNAAKRSKSFNINPIFR
jgi:hypothetical protein